MDLIEGDITETIPSYVKANPELKISLLNLDTDIYEPAVTILEHLYPKITKGGILMLDDYGTHPGETKAVDEYFKNKTVEIKMTLTAPGCPVAEEMPGCHRAPHKNSHRVSSPSLSFPLPRSVYCQNSLRFQRYCTVYGCYRTARSL